MTVLVCGGAGYIGSHTVLELLKKNYEVVVFDNLEKGHKNAVPKEVELIQGDLRNEEDVERAFKNKGIEAVIDFAAYSLVGESVEEPLLYFENNLGGTLNLLKAMNRHEVKNIVFSSTASVYGEPESNPVVETHQTDPKSPYGESKLCVEKMLKWADQAYDMKYSVLRYFNVAGADRSGTIGEDHTPETHLVPNVIFAALGKTDGIKIYGDDYETPDGTCIRDYLHVTDLSNAHILALNDLIQNKKSTTFNLGNGKGFSVKQIIDTVKKVAGVDFPTEVIARRPGDPAALVASSEKIIKQLGWKPQFNQLDQIIESALNWHKNHINGFSK